MTTAHQSERCVVHYRGHVQGVGFRYTAQAAAADFRVTGYVKNLPDGRVLLVAEGAPAEIERFLTTLRSRMARHIRDIDQTTEAATGEFPSFDIRF